MNSTSDNPDTEIPEKKNLVFATIKGIATGIGVLVASAALVDSVINSIEAKTFKLPDINKLPKIITGKSRSTAIISGGLIAAWGGLEFSRAHSHNRTVDKLIAERAGKSHTESVADSRTVDSPAKG